MTGAILITGILIGIVCTVALIKAILKIEEAREEEVRERLEARRRQLRMRQKMNEPREPQEQAIIEQTRLELQKRAEGGRKT